MLTGIRTNRVRTNEVLLYLLVGDVPANKHTMKITADHLIELPNHLMTEENSVPYYCPDCGKGMGYSFLSFQKHLNRYGRLCRKFLLVALPTGVSIVRQTMLIKNISIFTKERLVNPAKLNRYWGTRKCS